MAARPGAVGIFGYIFIFTYKVHFMKKFLLSFCAVVAAFGMANASTTTYNVNDAENLKGEDWKEYKNDDGSVVFARHIQPLKSFNLDEFMFYFDYGYGETDPAYYWATSTNANQQRTVRLYAGNTCTIIAPDGTRITKIEFKGSNAGSNLAFTTSTGSMTLSGSNATWSGNADYLKFSVSASWRFSELTITTGDTGETKVLWTGLEQTATDTDFIFENVVLPAASTYIWSWKSYNGAYYLNASAFVQNVAYASEAYAISPVIDLTGATGNITATFEHAAKFQNTLKDLCGLVVRTEGTTEWTKLAIPYITNNVYNRQKHPFQSPPLTRFFAKKDFNRLRDQLTSLDLAKTGIFDTAKVAKLIDSIPSMSVLDQTVYEPVVMLMLTIYHLNNRLLR